MLTRKPRLKAEPIIEETVSVEEEHTEPEEKHYIRHEDTVKVTTTKKVLWICWIIFIVLILLNIFSLDVETPLTIVGGVLTSIVTGFYMWKSKCENRQKIALGMVDELAEKYGIENVISLLSEILKE